MGRGPVSQGGGANGGNGHGWEQARDGVKKNRHHNRSRHQQDGGDGSQQTSMTTVRRRARAINRLLEHDQGGLPADVRAGMERELQAHSQRIEARGDERKRSKMVGRYHMVRFFERRKAERLVQRLRKGLNELKGVEKSVEGAASEAEAGAGATAGAEEGAAAAAAAAVSSEDARSRILADLHIAEVDLCYTKYFPLEQKYVSLYPKAAREERREKQLSQDDKNRAHLDAPRPPMWEVIERARDEGGDTELGRIRDSKDVVLGDGDRDKMGKKNRKKDGAPLPKVSEQDAEMSDGGGFFEEG